MLLNAILMIASSLAVFMIGQGGLFYLTGAILLGLGYIRVITLFFSESSIENARKVFLSSIIYLPVLITIIILEQFFY